MKKFGNFICIHKKFIFILSCILLILSFVGMKLTKVNYDILVYLPEDIETIKGQNILTEDFNMGSYSIAVAKNMSSKDILKLEEQIKTIEGVNEVFSLYDAIGTSIPIEIVPNELVEKVHNENSNIVMITFSDSTSSEKTLNAVEQIRKLAKDTITQGGMSSMVLDTMNLSEKEIFIYVVIAVILCIFVLELSLDSYLVPILLLANIGFAIVFNLGSNIFLGQISYITKALVAVLQLGVTTDFSIFLYHSYEKKKGELKDKNEAMKEAIHETFTSVTGSSLTTIAGFLVLCTMQLTLGKDLGIVMAKGVLLGVVCVLTLFPSLLLLFDKWVEKTKHKKIAPNFTKLNQFIIKHRTSIFILFLLLLLPTYLAYRKVDVYYKLDKSLPETLESIKTNAYLKEQFNIVSPEIILIDKEMKTEDVSHMTKQIEGVEGIDWVLSLAKLEEMGITKNMLGEDLLKMVQNENYEMILLNSTYETATNELNEQIDTINKIVKTYDEKAIVAGEGPLMKDLVTICAIDFRNVNTASIVCIFIILFFVLRSVSLPFLLITAIEFAIFTNMSFSYFGGVTLPFIAPIVLGTIQLGATIDYAILLTTTYLRKRRENRTKKDAMLETLNYCGNSIFTSGMCFFAATFGVGIYSKIEMIGALCSLIARGAIVSMFVVIAVLPSILLLFDKVIMKTTLKERKEKNMKKNFKKLEKATIWIMLISISISPISTFALTKKETVYTKLNQDGSIKSVLVNEQVINTKKLETLEDYSELEDILNVNNDNTFTKNKNKLIWNASGQDIFYQGTTNKSLPIELKITYKLNDEEKTLEEMLGKSGHVTISLKYKNKEKHMVAVNGKNEVLYTPFVIAVGTVLDNSVNSNITVTNGKVVSNGTKNIIAGLATPGLYESLKLNELKNMDTIKISYDTTKFELSSLYSVVTPKIIENSDLELFDKMDTIYSEVDSLQENMDKIENGAVKVANGSEELKNGLSSSMNNLQKENSETLTQEQIEAIKKQAVLGVNEKFTSTYKSSIAKEAWEKVKPSLSKEDATITNYVTNTVVGIMTSYLGEDNFKLYGACLQKSTGACEAFQEKNYVLEDVQKFQNEVTKQVTNTALKTAGYVAETVSKQVAVSTSEQAATQTASEVASSVSKQVANEVKKASINTVASSLKTLYDGVEQLDKGIDELSTGISTFNKEGITKVSSMINSKVKPVASKMKALTKLSNGYNSFATSGSLKNSDTKFIMVVDSAKLPKETNKQVENTSKVTFLDRLKNLFK